MSKVHIFIDGSWFFHVCAPNADGVLARKLAEPRSFRLDFNKLKSTILEHIQSQLSDCTEIGDCFNVTSIFSFPDDYDSWVGQCVDGHEITQADIQKPKNNVRNRTAFVTRSFQAGFKEESVIRPQITQRKLLRYINKQYREKEVDSTVVALIVKYAITKHNDYFAVIAGDADIMPALMITCPDYTKNICLVTSHPNELEQRHQLTAQKYLDFNFEIDPLFLQNQVNKIIEGDYVYRCNCCQRLYVQSTPTSTRQMPYCEICKPTA